MTQTHRSTLRIAAGGRIVIPADVREQLGMDVGTEVVLTVDGNHLTLINAQAARESAQDLVSRYIPASVSMSKELMAERKREAKGE